MRTAEATYTAPDLGAGTNEKVVPEALKKLGRMAVWAVAGAQFIDLIWRDADECSRQDCLAVSPSGRRLGQAELADLISRAAR